MAFCHTSTAASEPAEEEKALEFLVKYNNETPVRHSTQKLATWNFHSNLTSHNNQVNVNASLEYEAYMETQRERARAFDVSKLSEDTARQILFIAAASSPKDQAVLKRSTEVKSQLESLYSTAVVRDENAEKNLRLDPDLYRIVRESRDYDRLKFVWKGWRDASGRKMRALYEEFVTLNNRGAKDNNWKDTGEWWRSWYEVDNLPEIVEGLWESLKPLYQELHAYVRFKLRDIYPQISKDGPIPAHLFGNMWAQSWANIYDLVEPYKNKSSLDVTKTMVAKNMTAYEMVKLAESFFTSLGLEPLPKLFFNRSIIEKPDDGTEMVCHASAWDFTVKRDGARDARWVVPQLR